MRKIVIVSGGSCLSHQLVTSDLPSPSVVVVEAQPGRLYIHPSTFRVPYQPEFRDMIKADM